jgi:hypothetical protein
VDKIVDKARSHYLQGLLTISHTTFVEIGGGLQVAAQSNNSINSSPYQLVSKQSSSSPSSSQLSQQPVMTSDAVCSMLDMV